MNNWCIYWFFTHIFTGILIFKGLTLRRFYKSFGVKGLTQQTRNGSAGNRTSLFLAVTKRMVVIPYRRFEKVFRKRR
jgi:hypothetical protein